MTKASKEIHFIVALNLKAPTSDNSTLPLKHMLYIYYPVHFKKDQAKVRAQLDSNSKVNIITPAYTVRIGFKDRPTNNRAQKIDGSIFQTFGIALASFQVKDKFKKA